MTISDFSKDDTNKEIMLKYTSNGSGKTYTVVIDENGNMTVRRGIFLSESKINLNASDTEQLTSTLCDIDETVTWESSNQNVATVNSSGIVTAVADGRATITATCGGNIAKCLVIVGPPYGATANLGTVTVNNIPLEYDWKLFLEDDTNVYLIYQTYLETDQIPASSDPAVGSYGRGLIGYNSNDLHGDFCGSVITYLKDANIRSGFSLGIQAALADKSLYFPESASFSPPEGGFQINAYWLAR